MAPTDPAAPALHARRATAEDLPAIAEVHLRSRAAAHPAMPAGVHPDHEVRAWVAGWDLGRTEVWVATGGSGGAVVGYAGVRGDWLEDLYVDPSCARQGVGSLLLDVVCSTRPDGFCLWVFESNTPARRFYAARGLVELERTDGSANEERAPDLRMAWPGRRPGAFWDRLLAEVDADLADLHERRAALVRARGRLSVRPVSMGPPGRVG